MKAGRGRRAREEVKGGERVRGMVQEIVEGYGRE